MVAREHERELELHKKQSQQHIPNQHKQPHKIEQTKILIGLLLTRIIQTTRTTHSKTTQTHHHLHNTASTDSTWFIANLSGTN